MANNLKMANAGVNAEGNALGTLLNSGFIRIYDGVQPATADTALSGQTEVAELTFGGTAFQGASGGVIVANAITKDSAAVGGTAAWFRCVTSGGTAVFDGSVGTASADLILNSTTIGAGAEVSCSSFQHTVTK